MDSCCLCKDEEHSCRENLPILLAEPYVFIGFS